MLNVLPPGHPSTCALCGTVTVIPQHVLQFAEFNFCHFWGSTFPNCLLHIPPISPYIPPPPPIFPFPPFGRGKLSGKLTCQVERVCLVPAIAFCVDWCYDFLILSCLTPLLARWNKPYKVSAYKVSTYISPWHTFGLGVRLARRPAGRMYGLIYQPPLSTSPPPPNSTFGAKRAICRAKRAEVRGGLAVHTQGGAHTRCCTHKLVHTQGGLWPPQQYVISGGCGG